MTERTSRPDVLQHAVEHWSLTLGEPFLSQPTNYVTTATRSDGTPVVLKVGPPNPDIRREGEALRLFDGRGAVRLLDSDLDQGMLLLEQARPGTSLAGFGVPGAKAPGLPGISDEEAVAAACQVMRQLWRPAPTDGVLPRIERWVEFLRTEDQPSFSSLIDKARAVLPDLIQSSPAPLLLHGDLNPTNIVSAGREPWLAIDPKGEIGDPASEPGPWFYNVAPHLLSQHSLQQIFDRRLDQFAAELGFERSRIEAWAFVDAVLSACWSIEDHEDGWQWQVSCAQILAAHL